jgi:hypothetical protein
MLKGLPQDASSSDGEGDPWGRLGLPYLGVKEFQKLLDIFVR